jgi:putative heme-binding domain-containing protein
VRRHGIRLAEAKGKQQGEIRAAVLERVHDADAQVRHQLACTLGQWNHPEAGHALAQLALRSDNDRFAVAAIISSADTHYTELIDAAIEQPDRISDSLYNALLLTTETRRNELSRLLALNLSTEEQWDPARIDRLTAWLDLLRDRNRQLTSLQIEPPDALTNTIGQISHLMAKARQIAADEQADAPTRTSAITLLGREVRYADEDIVLLGALVSPHLPKSIQTGAIRALARIPDIKVADELVEQWGQLLPEARSLATDTLLSRTNWTRTLLEALREGEVTAADINLTHRQRLLTSRDASIAKAAKEILADPRTHERSDIIQQYESATVLVGQKNRGQKLFDEHCKTCHAIDKTQQLVGPDLRALTKRSPRALLSAILDPSQTIDPRYQNYNVILQSGEVLVGLVGTENANSIEIVDAEGKRRVILRDSIDLIQRAPLSLMPVGFEQKITPPQMNDLIAFLMELGSED